MQPSFLEMPDGRRLAYHLNEGKLPCVMFMGGFRSDMQGGKAIALETHCKNRGQRFIRFDYTGHGKSSGDFMHGTISSWKQDAQDVLEKLGSAQNILVGSSMGAWIALLLALQNKSKASGLVTIAAAPDFTEERIWEQFPDAMKKEFLEKGVYYAPSCYGEEPYPITRALIEDGRKNLLLKGAIDLDIPVRLLHGKKDEDVPWETSLRIMELLSSDDVELHLIKNGGHRLSEPENLQRMCELVSTIL